MKPKTVVIGLGLFGREIATVLARRGHTVLAVDVDPEAVEDIKDAVDQAVVLDTTDEAALREMKIDTMDTAVCAIGAQHMQDSILTTALLHQLDVPRIIARAADPLHARILRQVGATEVLNPEREMGTRIANQIATPGIREVLRLADDVFVAEIPIPPSFVGNTPAGLNIRPRYGVTVVGLQRGRGEARSVIGTSDTGEAAPGRKRQLILNLEPTVVFQEDDSLVVIGNEEDVKRLSGLA